jgi:hypothetical protein
LPKMLEIAQPKKKFDELMHAVEGRQRGRKGGGARATAPEAAPFVEHEGGSEVVREISNGTYPTMSPMS